MRNSLPLTFPLLPTFPQLSSSKFSASLSQPTFSLLQLFSFHLRPSFFLLEVSSSLPKVFTSPQFSFFPLQLFSLSPQLSSSPKLFLRTLQLYHLVLTQSISFQYQIMLSFNKFDPFLFLPPLTFQRFVQLREGLSLFLSIFLQKFIWLYAIPYLLNLQFLLFLRRSLYNEFFLR